MKIVFQHAGGSGAAVTTAVLQSTNQKAQAAPADPSYFPLRVGTKGTYRWAKEKYLLKPCNRTSCGTTRAPEPEGRGVGWAVCKGSWEVGGWTTCLTLQVSPVGN